MTDKKLSEALYDFGKTFSTGKNTDVKQYGSELIVNKVVGNINREYSNKEVSDRNIYSKENKKG